MAEFVSAAVFEAEIATASGIDAFGGDRGGLVVLTDVVDRTISVPELLPVVVALGADLDEVHPLAASVDVIAAGEDLDRLVELTERRPSASTALAVVLRGSARRSVADGLITESAVYGVLQSGPEFAEWRAGRPRRDRRAVAESVVQIEDLGDVTRVVLDRPAVRNALDATMRDQLAAVLNRVLDEPSRRIELSGSGPVFCSGGDLDEFGTRSDPASAHLVRMSRNLGWLLHQLADRVDVTVHGACAGSGVELPAFAGRVRARRDASFALPEVELGLIPGAGGTVSIPRRIGRHRTAWLGLTGQRIDAATAMSWGLVDEVVD